MVATVAVVSSTITEIELSSLSVDFAIVGSPEIVVTI